MTEEDVAATVQEFGRELLFAVLGLETQPSNTRAVFEVTLRGRRLQVIVKQAHPAPTRDE